MINNETPFTVRVFGANGTEQVRIDAGQDGTFQNLQNAITGIQLLRNNGWAIYRCDIGYNFDITIRFDVANDEVRVVTPDGERIVLHQEG
jgi:hypothetical protein